MAGIAENDGFSALCLHAGMGWRAASLLRAMARFIARRNRLIRPTTWRIPSSSTAESRPISWRCSLPSSIPAYGREKSRRRSPNASKSALAQVTSLDEDQIIRRYVNLVQAMLRTNYFRKAHREASRQSFPSSSTAARSRACPIPNPSPKYSSMLPTSRACICAAARWRAAVFAGRTGRRISAPKSWPRQGARRQECGDRAGRRQRRLRTEADAARCSTRMSSRPRG